MYILLINILSNLQVGVEDLSLTSLRLLLQLLEAKEILDQLTVMRPPMSADPQPASNKDEAAPPTSRMEGKTLMPSPSSKEDVRASGLTSEVEPSKGQQEDQYSPCEVEGSEVRSHLPDLLQDLGWMEAANSSNNNNRCRPPDVVLCTATSPTARATASLPEQQHSPEEQVLAKSDLTCPPGSSSQNSVKKVRENNIFAEEELQQEMTSINPGVCATWRQAGRQLRLISQACCDVMPSSPSAAAIGRPPAHRSRHVSAVGDVSEEEEVDGVLLTPSSPRRTAVDTVVDAVVHIVVNAVVYICVLKLKKIVL
jgi:hypothetical protein